MAYQQPPQGYPQQPMQPMQPAQPAAPLPMQGPFGGAPAAQPRSPAATTMLLLLGAFGLAALGLLLRHLTGFLDPSAGVLKLRNAGSMFFAFGSLALSLSLLWSAYKVFEQAAVRVMAIIGGVWALTFAYFALHL